MRKWILVALVVAAGCGRGARVAPAPSAALTGAASPREAAAQFLNAVKAEDLQAMSTVWGTESGPAREQLDRSDLEKRLIIMQGCYNHDRFSVVNETTDAQGARQVKVDIVRGNRTKSPTFLIVRGPSDRWYLKDTDFRIMTDFCAG